MAAVERDAFDDWNIIVEPNLNLFHLMPGMLSR